MRRPILTLLAGLLAASPAHAEPVPDDHQCMGPWVGTGRNTGSDSSWTIDLTLNGAPDGGRCGTIEYTNPACGGTLESCRLVGNEIHTREAYTHSEGDCAPAGRVIIRCDGATLHYAWIGWERVDSTLHRPQGWSSSRPPSQAPPPPQVLPPSDPPPPPPPPESRFGCRVAATSGPWPLLVLPPLVAAVSLRRRRASR